MDRIITLFQPQTAYTKIIPLLPLEGSNEVPKVVQLEGLLAYTRLFLLPSSMLLFMFGCINVQAPAYHYHYCNGENYTLNITKYQANLDLLLSSLSSSASTRTRFNSAAVGDSSDKCCGFFLCRGDVGKEDCRVCVDTGNEYIKLSCRNTTTAIAWSAYSNQSIFSITQENPEANLLSGNNVSDPDLFNYCFYGSVVTKEAPSLTPTILSSSETTGTYGKRSNNSSLIVIIIVVLTTAITSILMSFLCAPFRRMRIIPRHFVEGLGLLLLLLSYIRSITSQPTAYNCTDPSNSNRYLANLNVLLSSLSSNATSAPGGFYNATIGDVSDKVYGLFLCRGDITPQDCQTCVATAGEEITSLCPNMATAIVWYDYCMIRYTYQFTFSILQQVPIFYPYGPNNITNLDQYNQTVSDLMLQLVKQAAYGSTTPKYYAANEVNYYTGFDIVRGLVQCTPDITQDECNQCLIGSVTIDIPHKLYPREGGRVLKPSCNIRYEFNSPFYRQASSTPPPTNSTGPHNCNGSNSSNLIVSLVIIVAAVSTIIIISILYLCFRKRKQKLKLGDAHEEEIITVESLQFNFVTIRAATDNFSDENKLGQGGFGAVYKGKLPNGQIVAVKRLSRSSGQGEIEFMNEVLLVVKLQHRNLVRLLGFCLAGEERLLIYEFVLNKSLNHFIFDQKRRTQLNWERRHKIIGGIVRGLLYLHEDSRLRIIHRDLKASNILLDEQMNPKIADFGMARLFVTNETGGSTSRIVGTFGYMAPEYRMHGRISVKTDVFSFGVLLLEIVSGQRNDCFDQSGITEDLLSHAWRLWCEDTVEELIDPTLKETCPSTEMIRCIHIGLLCVQENASSRPTMASVILMLNSNSATLPSPSLPTFLRQSGSPTAGRLHSLNEASITELHPR